MGGEGGERYGVHIGWSFFAGIAALLWWVCGLHWAFAVIAGVTWATGVWSLTVLLKDSRFRKRDTGTGPYLIIFNVLLAVAANVGVFGLPDLFAEVRLGLALLILGVGMAGVGLGMLCGAAVAAEKEEPQRSVSR